MKRIWMISVTVLTAAALGWLAFGFFGVQTLFFDREVNEPIPAFLSDADPEPVEGPAEPREGNARENLLGTGPFRQGDSTYTISGDAFLSRIDGKVNLTFTDFEASNGPDLFVCAVRADSTDNPTVKAAVANGDFVNLGTLKGHIGNQNYIVEAELDPETYQVIAIWCRRFSRNFGSAQLAHDTLPIDP